MIKIKNNFLQASSNLAKNSSLGGGWFRRLISGHLKSEKQQIFIKSPASIVGVLKNKQDINNSLIDVELNVSYR